MKNIESIKGRVRCYLKSKVRITTALVVSFLITGTLSYSGSLAEILVDGESVQTLDSDNWTYTLEKGKSAKQIKIATDGYKGTFTNNGVIELTQEDTGSFHNAIEIDKKTDIVNNGSIAINYTRGIVKPIDITDFGFLNVISYRSMDVLRDSLSEDITITNNGDISLDLVLETTDIIMEDSANGIYVIRDIIDNQSLDEPNISTVNNGNITSKLNLKVASSIQGGCIGNGVVGDIGKNKGTIENNTSISGGEDSSETTNVNASTYIYDSGNAVNGSVKENVGTISSNMDVIAGKATSTVVEGNNFSYANAYNLNYWNGNGVLGDIEKNSGVISSNMNLKGGEVTTIGVNADASVYADYSGNGVMGDVGENTGSVSSLIKTKRGRATSAIADNHANSKIESSGNGIKGGLSLNTGNIATSIEIDGINVEYTESGNGIYNNTSNDSSVENSGRITTTSVVTGKGIKTNFSGIGFSEGVLGTPNDGTLKNTGVISTSSKVIGEDTTEVEASFIGVFSSKELENTGDISSKEVFQSNSSSMSETGIGSFSAKGINNSGRISSFMMSSAQSNNINGSGIGAAAPTINNSGDISSFAKLKGGEIGAQIVGDGVVGDIKRNSGSIKGHLEIETTESEDTRGSLNRVYLSGYGATPMIMPKSKVSRIPYNNVEENRGTIMGTHGSVYGSVGTNYGLLIGMGQQIYTLRESPMLLSSATNIDTNYGMDVIIDSDKEVLSVTYGDKNPEVYNTQIKDGNDSYDTFTQDILKTSYKVINGIGRESGVITTGGDLEIANTTVNSYYSALTIKDGHTVTATDSIFNGGGLGTLNNNGTEDVFDDFMEYKPIITGDSGSNTFIAKGNTIINGNIDLGDGSDTVTLYEDVIVNGSIDGSNSGEDTINIGVEEPQVLKMARSVMLIDSSTTVSNTSIYGSISNFENVNIDGDVTFFEEASLEGGKTINISDGSNLNIRIDGSKKDSDGNVSGHALYLFDGDIDFENSNGKLTLTPYNFGVSSILGFKDASGLSVLRGSESNIDVSSFLYKAEVEKGGLINIHLKSALDIDSRLNKIYEGISSGSTENIDKFNEITGGEESSVVSTLSQIYRATPGTYSPYISKVSSDLFTSTVITNAGMVEKDKWKIYGGAYGGRSEDDSTMSLGDIKRDTNVFGGYGLAEYGIGHRSAIGLAVGGNSSDTNLDGGSDLDGNSLNLGVYNKYIYKNYSFTSGFGYQYTSFDSARKLNGLEFKDTYNTNIFSVYTEGRYSYELGDTLKLEPNLQLRYTYVDQGSIDEGSDPLALNIDSDNFNYVDLKPALDLVKIIPVSNGFVELTTGIAYNFVYGDDSSSNMKGSFNGGSDFDLYIGDIDDTFEVKVRAEHQLNTGLYYDVEIKYRAGDDLNEYLGEVGMGYRF